MESKESLTNEKLRKKFKSQFELVNYAIKLAENMIKTGREPRVEIEGQNRALQIITEIQDGKDQFDEIPQPTIVVAATNEHINGRHSEERPFKNNYSERKKTREATKKL